MLPTMYSKGLFPNLMDEFFGKDIFPSFFNDEINKSMPAVNIKEQNDKFEIEVAAPGLQKEDFQIELKNNVLRIYSEKENKSEENKDNFMRQEFSYSSFSKSFTIPQTVDSDKISAQHKNGVLTVSIPKKETQIEKAPKNIEIN